MWNNIQQEQQKVVSIRLFKDIEIIIVDDCGSDKSIDIAKEYAKKDKRIKIVHNEKKLRSFKSKI